MSIAWMPFYIGDYLADTMHLTTGQHGAYLLLLMAYWQRGGPLPDDDDELMAIAKVDEPEKWPEIRKKVACFFQVRRGFWHHKRVESELNLRKTRQNAGRIGGSKRQANAQAKAKLARGYSQSQSQSQEDSPPNPPSQAKGGRAPARARGGIASSVENRIRGAYEAVDEIVARDAVANGRDDHPPPAALRDDRDVPRKP